MNEQDFYNRLKKKYPNIALPKELVSLVLYELLLYLKEVNSLKLKHIGNFFYKHDSLKFKSHKYFKDIILQPISKIVKSSVNIHQINLNSNSDGVYNTIQNEQSIVADSDFDIDDLF